MRAQTEYLSRFRRSSYAVLFAQQRKRPHRVAASIRAADENQPPARAIFGAAGPPFIGGAERIVAPVYFATPNLAIAMKILVPVKRVVDYRSEEHTSELQS